MEKNSDICLVIEGSYPYVTGGVSAWVQWLMENMKEYTFSIAALIAEPKNETDRRYRLPDNVVSYHEYVIFDYQEIESAKPLKISKRRWRRLSEQALSAHARLAKRPPFSRKPGVVKRNHDRSVAPGV